MNHFERGKQTKEKVLEVFRVRYRTHQPSPSIRELCDAVGISSSATMYFHLRDLRQAGKLAHHGYRDPVSGQHRVQPRAYELSLDEKVGVSLVEFDKWWADEYPTVTRDQDVWGEEFMRRYRNAKAAWMASRGFNG
jgi:hypothetical protein